MKRRIYFDLDRTLYDTNRMVEVIRADMIRMGNAPAEVDRCKTMLNRTGYTFEDHLRCLGYVGKTIVAKADEFRLIQADGNRFLYPEVVGALPRLKELGEFHLLTSSVPAYQRHKFESILALSPYFTKTHYVWGDQTKGDVVREARREGVDDWVIDDSVPQLEDIRVKAPSAHLVRMCRPDTACTPHPGDGLNWSIVHDLNEFVQLLEAT